VRLAGDTGSDLIVRAEAGLTITWTDASGRLRTASAPTSRNGCTPAWWRTLSSGSGLSIEHLCGESWVTWQGVTAVSATRPVTFSTADGSVDTAVRAGSGFDRKAYRGSLEGTRSGSSVLVTNIVALEDYLLSVVPSEVPPSWPTQTLRAQAVAARTFALRERADSRRSGFDVYDDTRSQVYRGLHLYDNQWNVVRRYEDARSSAAVRDTAGVSLEIGGAPVLTQFSASNGGWTAGSSLPYQTVREDSWDWAATQNSRRTWTSTVQAASLESRYPQIGRLARVRIVQRDGGGMWGGRVVSVVVEGSSGTVRLSGDSAIRSAFGTLSSYFTVTSG
jgi:SpoIID/LytB domain protein